MIKLFDSIKPKLISLTHYLPVLLFFLLIIGIIIALDTETDFILFDLIKSIRYGDKIAHFLIYGILTWLLNVALRFRTRLIMHYQIQSGAILVFIFTFLEELSQAFFPNRTVDAGDMLANILGIALMSYLSCKWHKTPSN